MRNDQLHQDHMQRVRAGYERHGPVHDKVALLEGEHWDNKPGRVPDLVQDGGTGHITAIRLRPQPNTAIHTDSVHQDLRDRTGQDRTHSTVDHNPGHCHRSAHSGRSGARTLEARLLQKEAAAQRCGRQRAAPVQQRIQVSEGRHVLMKCRHS